MCVWKMIDVILGTLNKLYDDDDLFLKKLHSTTPSEIMANATLQLSVNTIYLSVVGMSW